MIQINLIPDSKRELLGVQRHRNLVIVAAVAAMLLSLALVVVVSLYVFGLQRYSLHQASSQIQKAQAEFIAKPDIEKLVTISNQLDKIEASHQHKHMTSRVFNLLAAASMKGSPSSVAINSFTIDTEQKQMTLSVQTEKAGFEAADVFKKNLEAMRFYYVPASRDAMASDQQDPPITRADNEHHDLVAQEVIISDLAYVETNSGGARAVSFKASFSYDERFLSQQSDVLRLRGLGNGNVTDSHQRLPEALFKNAAQRGAQ